MTVADSLSRARWSRLVMLRQVWEPLERSLSLQESVALSEYSISTQPLLSTSVAFDGEVEMFT